MEEQTKMGRPTIYTPELRAELCRRLASGRTLRSVCRDEDMPCRDIVQEWLLDCHKEEGKDKAWISDNFSDHYARAREIQAENVHDEIVEIADHNANDFIDIEMKNGKTKTIFDKEAVLRSKLRVDARLAWLANTSPRKYGRNVKVESQMLGKEGQPVDPSGTAAATDAFMDTILEAIKKGEKTV